VVEEWEKEKQVPYITSVERYGREEGKREGLREGLFKAIALGLKLKFGPEGLQLMPAIQALTEVDKLEALYEAVEKATSLDELRRLCS
jgi:hypothetical protein